MIDINADIISYKSLGNIEIGRDVEFYADELYENFDVEERTWEKSCFSNEVGYELKYIYSLNNGTITICTNCNGRIEELWCNQNIKENIEINIKMNYMLALQWENCLI